MQQYKSFKYRIYPTKQQEQQLAQFFGAKRWIYNHFLNVQKERFKNEEKHLSFFDMGKEITKLKKQEETAWLRDMDVYALRHAVEDLSVAYKNFFDSKKGKRKGKKLEEPVYKKRSNLQSYRTRQNISVSDKGLKVAKIKTHININLSRPVVKTIKSATISKTPSGKYFVSLLCETEIALKDMTGREVGIDLGLCDLAILSDSTKFQHPEQLLAKAKQQLKKQQKILSRKTKGSKKRDKARIKVARAYERVTNIRNDYYHNLSYWLVCNYDVIYMEDLNVAGILKNRKLSRKVHETAWSTLVSMIEYKCNWYGKTFHKIDRWAPSSKTCSVCDNKLDFLDLSVREWTCPVCDTHHDRDINAAKNIRNMGQKDLYNKQNSCTIRELGNPVIPVALQKHVSKIERSSDVLLVDVGSGQITHKELCYV